MTARPLPNRDTDVTDPADALAAQLLGGLLDETDPLTRWRAITTVAARLDWVRALTVDTLLAQGMTQRAAAEHLHLSKGRVSQLAGKTPVEPAAHAWGQALAVAVALAATADPPGSTDHRERADLVAATGMTTPTVWSDLEDVVPVWVSAAHALGRAAAAESLLERLVGYLGAATELPDELTLDQRAAVQLGFHTEHANRPTT